MRVLSHLPAVIGFLALPALCGGMDAVSPKVPGSGCHAHVVVPLALLMAFPVIAAAFRSLAEVSRRFARRASVPAFSASVLFLLLYAVPALCTKTRTPLQRMIGGRGPVQPTGVPDPVPRTQPAPPGAVEPRPIDPSSP